MRNKYINASISPLEFRALTIIGDLENLNVSKTMRWLIREEAKRKGIPIGLVDELPYHQRERKVQNADHPK